MSILSLHPCSYNFSESLSNLYKTSKSKIKNNYNHSKILDKSMANLRLNLNNPLRSSREAKRPSKA